MTPGDLQHSELAGGHTLAKHVGKTEPWLRERLRTTALLEASSFTTIEEAAACIGRALVGRDGEIDAWLQSGSRDRLRIDVQMDVAAGLVVSRVDGLAKPGPRVLVVLKPLPDGTPPYYVLTAYPRR